MGDPTPISRMMGSTITSSLRIEDKCPKCGGVPVDHEITVMGRVFRFPGICPCERNRLDREEAEFQNKQRRTWIEHLFSNSGLGERYREVTFDTWDSNPGTQEAYNACRAFVESWPKPCKTGKGLILLGPLGTGKTHLVAAIANALIVRRMASVIYESVPDLLGRLRYAISDPDRAGASEWDLIQGIVIADLLILDDLGTEKMTERAEEQFYRIINGRYNKKLPIVITTNLPLDGSSDGKHLKNAIGQRCLDRLVEVCEVYKLSGTSYRIKKRRAEAEQ